MKIMTVLGTRPEIIRLSLIIPLLDRRSDHILVHTGQNYTETLSDVFFDELGIREPDVYLGIRRESFGAQIGAILEAAEQLFLEHRPDRLLILGDTNSALVAIVAKRLGIPVYHMEAGNRCFDDRVPEEVNRRIIDHSSSVLLPYTERSKANLVREGFPENRIYVTGNPIGQVLDHYADQISASTVLDDLGLAEGEYFLVTAHRAENVDDPERLANLLEALSALHREYGHPVIVSMHPRTRSQADRHGLDLDVDGIRFLEPLGFFDFVRLEQSSFCVLTDSGTVQEETCILRVPNVTIRDVTERPETLDVGSGILTGLNPGRITDAVALVTAVPPSWKLPIEYLVSDVAVTVVRIVLGYRSPTPAEWEWINAHPRREES
ncbi:MAG: UDP-N-acetylglucosamine 2-epimerase (non-hydrolyzing) [Actinomycetia bacterium]|nr:UDP-N-acetylglucosamine 2-epimerase (non-hydrolyzing) [Actinomycetes bacterium]